MLASTIFFSLLASMVSAAVLTHPLQPLNQDASLLALDQINMTAFERFPIEDMSNAKFLLHHHTVKALVGARSYIALRTQEMEMREREVWNYLWNQSLRCQSWPDDEDDAYPYHPHIWLSGGRIFNADPERVPQEVITHLEELSEQEGEKRRELRRQSYCNINQTLSEKDKTFDKDKDAVYIVSDAPDVGWKAEVPEEYLRYLIPKSVLEEEERERDKAWKAKDEKRKREILAGTRSVRDFKMPDLSKCTKREIRTLVRSM
ncbi:hypothetical protein D6C99_10510 [Aureobasidium pullulans]|nr:hypothetical protein D6C99_10510 [Aureobasidium pullulans]